MELIREQFPSIGIDKTDALEVPGDAKEAVLFAALANEAVAGEAIDFKGRDGMPSCYHGQDFIPGFLNHESARNAKKHKEEECVTARRSTSHPFACLSL